MIRRYHHLPTLGVSELSLMMRIRVPMRIGVSLQRHLGHLAPEEVMQRRVGTTRQASRPLTILTPSKLLLVNVQDEDYQKESHLCQLVQHPDEQPKGQSRVKIRTMNLKIMMRCPRTSQDQILMPMQTEQAVTKLLSIG